jgi:hypothetical protein
MWHSPCYSPDTSHVDTSEMSEQPVDNRLSQFSEIQSALMYDVLYKLFQNCVTMGITNKLSFFSKYDYTRILFLSLSSLIVECKKP